MRVVELLVKLGESRNVRRSGIIIGIGLAALTLAINKVVLMLVGIVIGIGLTALTLAVNKVVLMLASRIVIGIGLAALTLAVNIAMLVLGAVTRA
jgi:hypothetical protein